MTHVLALDQGTTSSRAIVFDATGAPVAVAQQEFAQHFPHPGWVEHDANEIWTTQVAVAAQAVEQAGLKPRDLAAIGVTNQRETTILWDRATGEPIARAIVWQDRRTADVCARLKADGAEPAVREKTGLVLDPYFSATKIAWLLDHTPDARARAERGGLAFGTIDCFLAWRLTNGARHVTDPSNASRTLLYNLHTGTWDDELLDLFNVPRSVLPEIVPSGGVIATLGDDAPLPGATLASLIGDQQAATVGQHCTAPGLAKNTYGTGCFLLMNTGHAPATSDHGLLATVAWAHDDATHFALEGSVFTGGAVVQWLRDGLGVINSAAEIEALARDVDDNGGVCFVPALTGLGAPHWDPHARGAILGLTRGSGVGHLARAALEGVALSVADLVDAMQADAETPLAELRVDGGAAANDLLMQIQADLLGVPVVRPTVLETTALGAAILAGVATGAWSAEAMAEQRAIDRIFEPQISRDAAETQRAQWRRAVERARGWADDA